MNINQLKTFVCVSNLGSFSKAASALGIAQSSLSRQVKILEQEVGAPLLYRHGHGVRLTAGGRRYLDAVGPLLEELHRVQGSLRRDMEAPRGTVRVGMLNHLLETLGPDLVRDFNSRHQGSLIQIVAGTSAVISDLLDSGRIDIGLLYRMQGADSDSQEHIYSDSLNLVGTRTLANRHRLAPGVPVPLRKLGELPLVLAAGDDVLRRTIEKAVQSLGIALNTICEVNSPAAVKACINAEMGFGILSTGAMRTGVDLSNVYAEMIVSPRLAANLVLIVNRTENFGKLVASASTLMRNRMKGADLAFPG